MFIRLLMLSTTILVILVLIFRNINDKRFLGRIISTVKEINRQYVEIFRRKSLLRIIIHSGMLIISQIFMSVSIITYVWRYIDTYLNSAFDIIIKILIMIVFIIIIYLSVGYVSLITSKIYHLFSEVENKNIKNDLILSYFLLTTYFTILIFSSRQFEKNNMVGLIGVGICYALNLRVLVSVIKDPKQISSRDCKEVSVSSYAIVSALILIMIILNLFLGVCFINNIAPGSYSGYENNFDLFYYTIITFTTIGYGDVVPVSPVAKMMSIIISFTSVICITIFLSSILSYKDNK